jgi:hypothetical protein
VHIEGAKTYQIDIENPNKIDPTGLARRIQNTISRLPDVPEDIRARIAQERAEIPKLEKQIGPWQQAAELDATRNRHRELLDQLRPKKAPAAAQEAGAVAQAERRSAIDDSNVSAYSEAEEIVRQVAGDVDLKWQPIITVEGGSPGWGIPGTFEAAGLYEPLKDAITLSWRHGTKGTAYHEAFHRLQNLFITPAERDILKAEWQRLRRIVASDRGADEAAKMSQLELEAESFALWATRGDEMKTKPPAAIQQVWNKIVELVRRLHNLVTGLGLQTTEDVFARAKSGAMKSRAPSADPNLAPGKLYSMPAARAAATVTESRVIDEVKGKLTDLSPTLLAAVPLNYFPELKRSNMTAVDDYMRVKRAMDAYRGTKHADADAIAQDWLKYIRLGFLGKDKAKAKVLGDLMHDSTLAGVDPSRTDDETKALPGYDALRARYQALAPAGKELYNRVRDAYSAQAEELDQILLDNVRKAMQIELDRAEVAYKDRLAEIKRSGLKGLDVAAAMERAANEYRSASTKANWSMKARLTKLRIAFENSRVAPPYFPLGRFGQYFVTVRDVDGSLLSFSKFEKAADRDRAAAQLRKDHPTQTVTAGVMEDRQNVRQAMDPRVIAEIETILGNARVGEEIMDAVWQRYLESMPDLSARKRFIHRSGVAGFNEDALRVFSNHMFHASHQMARTKFGLELQELVNQTVDQAQDSDDQTKGMRLANELKRRHEWVMNPTGGPVAQIMTSAAFVWMLAASPASAIVNLTQTGMVGIPVLAARYGGPVKASAAILKASRDFIAGKGHAANANITADEKRAMEKFYESGLIDRTQSHDLAGVGETGVRYSPVRAKVMGIISALFHHTERANREVTALAAYRLARDAGMNQSDAIDAAHEATYKTHFDFSNSSRPRLMQNDFAKVALVFRSYQINMLYRLFRDLHQTIKGESPQVRREARYQLAGVLGMQALMAGVSGVAGFNLAMALASMIFGDDDDPMDFEQKFRADVIDVLGPQLGGVVLNGAPGHYLGVDLTSRIGMPDLWFRSPGKDLQGREEYQYWLSQMLGAAPSIGERMWQGFSVASDGDVARGVEIAAPKFIGDLMKAYRYSQEGLTNLKGDEIIPAEDIDAADILKQSVGFTPAKVSEAWDRKSALENAESRVNEKRKRLVNKFALAIAMQDPEARQEAIDAIRRFNAVPLNRTVAITSKTLEQSLATRARNVRKREDGALIDNPGLSRILREELPERVYQ